MHKSQQVGQVPSPARADPDFTWSVIAIRAPAQRRLDDEASSVWQ